jgi:hypothetical protein
LAWWRFQWARRRATSGRDDHPIPPRKSFECCIGQESTSKLQDVCPAWPTNVPQPKGVVCRPGEDAALVPTEDGAIDWAVMLHGGADLLAGGGTLD